MNLLTIFLLYVYSKPAHTETPLGFCELGQGASPPTPLKATAKAEASRPEHERRSGKIWRIQQAESQHKNTGVR